MKETEEIRHVPNEPSARSEQKIKIPIYIIGFFAIIFFVFISFIFSGTDNSLPDYMTSNQVATHVTTTEEVANEPAQQQNTFMTFIDLLNSYPLIIKLIIFLPLWIVISKIIFGHRWRF